MGRGGVMDDATVQKIISTMTDEHEKTLARLLNERDVLICELREARKQADENSIIQKLIELLHEYGYDLERD
jgi:succinate dehydrogenase flavin-adding protein (antitoxin of CptAB toxin-antitoxin module)